MRLKIFFSLILIVSLFYQCDVNQNSITGIDQPTGQNNIAYYWAKVALDATARDTERFAPRPTITSRYLGLIFTAVFDAWTVYNPQATPVYFSYKSKHSPSLRAKEIAISYAAYHTLKEYYYSDSLYFDEKMLALGLDPKLISTDPNSPAGIGYQAAREVINARIGDGANQYGEASDAQTPYGDYTNYMPVNPPETNNDINRWQPKYFISATGESYAPSCLTPYWQHVKPISLTAAYQFRSPPPPYYGSDQLREEVAEVVALQASLTTAQKGLVEFMRDGPQSVQQAGHWLVFAQEVSKRDQHNLDEDVKMYFLNQITAMDAFIASWDTKMFYDYARPYALVHQYYQGKKINGWKGYDQGWGSLQGEQCVRTLPISFCAPLFQVMSRGTVP